MTARPIEGLNSQARKTPKCLLHIAKIDLPSRVQYRKTKHVKTREIIGVLILSH